jgi:hypothetical protein
MICADIDIHTPGFFPKKNIEKNVLPTLTVGNLSSAQIQKMQSAQKTHAREALPTPFVEIFQTTD